VSAPPDSTSSTHLNFADKREVSTYSAAEPVPTTM
jgi:hypothetical protein